MKQTGGAGEFLVGELEEEVGGFPVGEEGLGFVESGVRGVGANVIEERARAGVAEVEGAVGPVTEGVKKGAGGLGEGAIGEVPEGGLDGFALVGHVPSAMMQRIGAHVDSE